MELGDAAAITDGNLPDGLPAVFVPVIGIFNENLETPCVQSVTKR